MGGVCLGEEVAKERGTWDKEEEEEEEEEEGIWGVERGTMRSIEVGDFWVRDFFTRFFFLETISKTCSN